MPAHTTCNPTTTTAVAAALLAGLKATYGENRAKPTADLIDQLTELSMSLTPFDADGEMLSIADAYACDADRLSIRRARLLSDIACDLDALAAADRPAAQADDRLELVGLA